MQEPKVIVIREDLLNLTGSWLEAAILYQFLSWDARDWIHISPSELKEEIMFRGSTKTVRRALNRLVEKELLSRRIIKGKREYKLGTKCPEVVDKLSSVVDKMSIGGGQNVQEGDKMSIMVDKMSSDEVGDEADNSLKDKDLDEAVDKMSKPSKLNDHIYNKKINKKEIKKDIKNLEYIYGGSFSFNSNLNSSSFISLPSEESSSSEKKRKWKALYEEIIGEFPELAPKGYAAKYGKMLKKASENFESIDEMLEFVRWTVKNWKMLQKKFDWFLGKESPSLSKIFSAYFLEKTLQMWQNVKNRRGDDGNNRYSGFGGNIIRLDL